MSESREPRDRRSELEREARRIQAEERGLDRYLEYRDNSRLGLWRQALIYVPSGVIATVLLVVALMNLPGSIIGLVILAIFAIPLDVEAIQAVRDLLEREPVASRGSVERLWAKSRFMFFGRVRYLLADMRRVEDGRVDPDRKSRGTLFEVGEVASLELVVGDEIEVVHWPHTNAIVSVERVSGTAGGSSSSQTGRRPERGRGFSDRNAEAGL